MVLFGMHPAPHFPIETLAYVFVETHVTFYMVHIFVRMQLASHVLVRTLVIAYVPFKMHLTPIMVNIFIKMHLAHRWFTVYGLKPSMFLLKHKTKSIMPFK